MPPSVLSWSFSLRITIDNRNSTMGISNQMIPALLAVVLVRPTFRAATLRVISNTAASINVSNCFLVSGRQTRIANGKSKKAALENLIAINTGTAKDSKPILINGALNPHKELATISANTGSKYLRFLIQYTHRSMLSVGVSGKP
jgi:hypothetical protein